MAGFAGEEFEGGVGDKTPGDPVGDAHGKGHNHDGQEGGQGFGEVIPVDMADMTADLSMPHWERITGCTNMM